MIDLDKWNCGFGRFNSAVELCKHISINGRNNQNPIQKYLKKDKNYPIWKKHRRYLKDIPFYKKYRTDAGSKKINKSAENIISQNHTPTDRKLVFGLVDEINTSSLVLQRGQKLFHGSAMDISNKQVPFFYPVENFLSCTLCPEVAAHHAIKDACNNKSPAVFIIALSKNTKVIFGATGKLTHEQEVLLSYNQCLEIIKIHKFTNGEFIVIEANIK